MSALSHHRGALAADLRRYYSTDLDELWACNPWSVAAWVEHLPADSAVRRAQGDGWSLADHLLASAVDALQGANWQRANTGVAKGKQSPHPKPVPRPGDDPENTRKSSVTGAQLLEFRRRHKDNESG